MAAFQQDILLEEPLQAPWERPALQGCPQAVPLGLDCASVVGLAAVLPHHCIRCCRIALLDWHSLACHKRRNCLLHLVAEVAAQTAAWVVGSAAAAPVGIAAVAVGTAAEAVVGIAAAVVETVAEVVVGTVAAAVVAGTVVG